MIIVLGSIKVKESCLEEALKISQMHVERSRTEPGCIEHGVHIDFENPERLVFVEKWSDQSSITQHFKEPASIQFVKNLESMVTEPPEISVYEASQLGE